MCKYSITESTARERKGCSLFSLFIISHEFCTLWYLENRYVFFKHEETQLKQDHLLSCSVFPVYGVPVFWYPDSLRQCLSYFVLFVFLLGKVVLF